MKIIYKDSLNLLADDLINELQFNKNPFDTIYIIVPNLLVEQWFKTYWLKCTNKVLMNVKFYRLNPFINEIYGSDLPLMSKGSMALFIADILLNNKELFSEINKYYENNNINLYDLSNKLADLFIKYEEDLFEPTLWQRKLLDMIKEKEGFSFISNIINNDVSFNHKAFLLGFTKLNKLYLKAFDKLDNITLYIQNNIVCDYEFKVCAAASKEREIEYIHGVICDLLKDNNTKLYDILVYAPNIEEYRGAIKKVFEGGANEGFPIIPYVLLGNNHDQSNAGEAISLLYKVLIKDQFTRSDFYKLLSNPNIAQSRGIDLAIINDLIEALDNMNVYRDNTMCDEWLYAVRRLLLSKLIGGSFNIENSIMLDEEYLPYGSIAMNDNAINCIVDVVDDIYEFRKRYKSSLMTLEDIRLYLDKWLSYNNNVEETNYYYNASLKVLSFIIDNNLSLPLDIVFEAMINASKNISVTPSNIINGGVTFVNFNETNVIASKYIFFLGLSSKNLPRLDRCDEIDQRDEVPSATKSDIDTFNYLNNNGEFCYYSYVNMNLKSLEEYPSSSLINNKKPDLILGLREDREYSSLYSKSEFKKKLYDLKLTKEISKEEKKLFEYNFDLKVKHRELSDFINEPLMAKMKRLFQENDDILEMTEQEYEPLVIDNITKSNIKKDLLLEMINNSSGDLGENIVKDVINKYKITHAIPYLVDDFKYIYDDVKEYYNLTKGYKIVEPFSVSIPLQDKLWELVVTNRFMLMEDEERLDFKELNPKSYSRYSSYSRIYIIALAYLVLNSSSNKTIYLDDLNFTCDSSRAIEILNELYLEYNNYDNIIIAPLDAYDKNDYDSVIRTIRGDNGAWKYFDDGKMITDREFAGYTRETFSEVWEHYKEFLKRNVLYLGKAGVKK